MTNPANPGSNELTPTSAELKKLVEAAVDGNKAAQAKLEEILKELPQLRGRVDAIEARLKKEEEPEPAEEPAPEPKKVEPKKPRSWAPWDVE